MVKRICVTVELKNIGLSDGTLPLHIIKVGTVEGITPSHAALLFGLTDIEMKRLMKTEKIETDKVPSSGTDVLIDAGIISPKAGVGRFLSRSALYRLAKAIGTKAAKESLAALWRVGRPFGAMTVAGKVLTPKSMLAECMRRLDGHEQRIAALEVKIQKVNEFLMDNVTIELSTQEKAQ